jgi:hypothetical protein
MAVVSFDGDDGGGCCCRPGTHTNYKHASPCKKAESHHGEAGLVGCKKRDETSLHRLISSSALLL